VDATILEKSKAQPHLREEAHLYKRAWYLHFKYLARPFGRIRRSFRGRLELGNQKGPRCTPYRRR
jgi:hypothetical protein